MTHVKFVIYRENKVHHTPSAIKLRLSNNLGLNPACTAADNRIWLQIKKVLNSVQREKGGVGERERMNWKRWWDVLVKTQTCQVCVCVCVYRYIYVCIRMHVYNIQVLCNVVCEYTYARREWMGYWMNAWICAYLRVCVLLFLIYMFSFNKHKETCSGYRYLTNINLKV